MACNLEDGEAGSGWILSISGRVPTIPIYPRIIARQENMETSVPSEPSIGHDICPEIYHPTPAHIMAHGCCKDTQDGSTIQIGNIALSQKIAQRQTRGSLSHHLVFSVSERNTEQSKPPAPPTVLGERACMIPTTPVLRQKACCVPKVVFLAAIRPGRASRRLAGGTLTSTSLSMLHVSNAKIGQSPDSVIRGEMAETWKCSSDRDLHLPGII